VSSCKNSLRGYVKLEQSWTSTNRLLTSTRSR
jgi:hypothetical protein